MWVEGLGYGVECEVNNLARLPTMYVIAMHIAIVAGHAQYAWIAKGTHRIILRHRVHIARVDCISVLLRSNKRSTTGSQHVLAAYQPMLIKVDPKPSTVHHPEVYWPI